MRLTGVGLREERRRWTGASLLGGPLRRTWIVELQTDQGRAEGEIAWLPRVGPVPDVASVVAVWAYGWMGRELPDALEDPALPPPVAWAITSALADLQGRESGRVPESGLLTGGEGTPEQIGARWSAEIRARPAVEVWKVKVGRTSLEEDLARLRALDIPAGVTLRLDPNQRWGAHDPSEVARQLEDLPIAFVEQPAPWPDLQAWGAVPTAADESVAEVVASELAEAGVEVLVFKPSVLGGLGAVLRRVREAMNLGLQVVLSSSLEGPVGRTHLEALHRMTPEPRHPVGMARNALEEFPDDVEFVESWACTRDPLQRAAERFPQAVAIEGAERLTFAEWDRRASEGAAFLGNRTGERFVLAIDEPEGAIRLFAVLRAGGIAALAPPGVQREPAIEQVGADPWSAGDGTPPGVALDRPATLLWSSGSQGRPRAIAHSLGQHMSSAAASHVHTPFEVGDRWLASLRMHHVGGLALLFRAIHAGGTVVFSGETPWESTAPTHLSWVPTQLTRAAEAPPESLKHVLIGGAAAPPDLIESRRRSGWPLKTTYGSTELASQVCTSTVGSDASNSGAALLGRTVEANPAIRVRGTTVCLGTWQDGRIVPLDTGGWLRTGDVGEITPSGELRVRGRADTMFISGGENVFPESIERVLGAHPAVRAVVVVDVPDREWGARPWAFVDGDLDLDTAREFSVGRLPRHAWVDRVLPWEAEGVGATGKPRRAWFRARAADIATDLTGSAGR